MTQRLQDFRTSGLFVISRVQRGRPSRPPALLLQLQGGHGPLLIAPSQGQESCLIEVEPDHRGCSPNASLLVGRCTRIQLESFTFLVVQGEGGCVDNCSCTYHFQEGFRQDLHRTLRYSPSEAGASQDTVVGDREPPEKHPSKVKGQNIACQSWLVLGHSQISPFISKW